jgi:hypothetical protein
MATLILKRGSTSRSSGTWGDDDYDVLEGGVVVGRIMLSLGAPQDRPWMWASGHNGDIRRAAHGYEPTREAAMGAFAKSWRKARARTHKSSRHFRFRANQTSSRRRRMTESDVVDGARSQQRGAIG